MIQDCIIFMAYCDTFVFSFENILFGITNTYMMANPWHGCCS